MPRPRILCSPRSKRQNTVENVKKNPQVVTITKSEEPDCEIIKIEDGEDEKMKFNLQVRGVAQVQYRGSQCLPSMLSLQFLPATTSSIAGRVSGQNVVTVLPVNSSQLRVSNPMLCTLEKIENVVAIGESPELYPKKEKKLLKNTHTNDLQPTLPCISQEKQPRMTERLSDRINVAAKNQGDSMERKVNDSIYQQPGTSTFHDQQLSVVEINSGASREANDCLEKPGTQTLRAKKIKVKAATNENKISTSAEFSDTSGSLENRKDFFLAENKINSKSNIYKNLDRKISLSKISINRKNLIINGKSCIREKSVAESNFSVEKKSAILASKRLVNDKKEMFFVEKEAKKSKANPETSILMQKSENYGNSIAKSNRSASRSRKSTDNENDFDSHEDFSSVTESIVEIDDEEDFPEASKSIESGMKYCVAKSLWNLNCIVCGRKFNERRKLHKHATLEHPNMQILFCEFCNESFLTHEKLKMHRIRNCKSEITEIVETIVIEDEEDDSLSSEEITKNIGKKRTIRENNNSLDARNTEKNNAAESQKVKNRGCSANILIKKKRGRPPKNFTNFAIHKYVEEEVINHAFGAKKKELVTAEIKKLVVPIARLKDSTLKKYLGKCTDSTLSDYQDEEANSRKNFRKKKRRRFRKNYNNVGNLKRAPKSSRKIMELKKLKTNLRCTEEMINENFFRLTDKIVTRNSFKRNCSEKMANSKNRGKIVGNKAKKRPIYTVSDVESEESGSKHVSMVEENHSGNKQRPIIRKLPSRSSAASLESLKMSEQCQQRERVEKKPEKTYEEWILRRQKIVDSSEFAKKSVNKHTEPQICLSSREPSNIKTINDKKLDEVNDEQLIELSKNLEENWQEKPKSERKTYSSSKRKGLNAKKCMQRCDPTSENLCLMCKELVELMKQLAGYFDGNKAHKTSVKCPLCNLYFISMYYLKTHVSRFHLQCQYQFPSQLSESLMLMRPENDESFDCENEIVFSFECQHCPVKFSEETELVDHVFTQHDTPIFYDDNSTDFPYYVNDFPNSYFRTNSIEFSAKSRRSKPGNQLDVKRKSSTLTSESVDDEAAKNSSKSRRKSEKNLNNESIKLTNKAVKVAETSESAEKSAKLPNTSKVSPNEPSKDTRDDQATLDRNYLLKQLLSDDSNENFDDPKSAKLVDTQKQPKSARKIIFKSESDSTRSECHICKKEFSKIQDLLNHSLEHDFSNANNIPSDFIIDVTNYWLTDSTEYEWFNNELTVSMALRSQTAESGTTALIAENQDTSDLLYASGTEINDFSPVHNNSDEMETEMESAKKRSASSVSKSLSKNEENENTCLKKHRLRKRASNFDSEDTKTQNKKLKVLQEFLETEDGLANPDEADTTRKVPIECSKCNRKFPNQASLNEHLFFLHDDTLKDTVLTDVVSPMSRNDDGSSKEPQQWRCDECLHNFKFFQSYARHRYFIHGDDEMVHVCENCCKVMTTVTMVNVHICTDVASYNCRTCNETFKTGMSLRLHNMYKHKETEGPHKCLPCDKKFLTNAMLKRHEQWEHRFMRPYRPRKSSPVHMATCDDVNIMCDDHFVENNIASECDEKSVDMEYDFTGKQASDGPNRVLQGLEVSQNERKSQEQKTSKQKRRDVRKDRLKENRSVTYIDEDEIIQCNFCRLYCLSMTALRTHMANSHSIMGEVCKICEKMYSKGKLIRHMIDQHINPCETYREDKDSIWNVGKSVEEKDAEQLISMLGMSRLISLCEYQRFTESTEEGAVRCPNCAQEFDTGEDYKFHFLLKHDIMCALCNIEFKSGEKAALHKTEDHGSVDSYIWFADHTVGALTAATNFSKAAEKTFIEMISIDSDEANDDEEDEICGEENWTSRKNFPEETDEKSKYTDNYEAEESLVLEEENDEKLMIVVTDDDLRYYGIGTRNPNIWGLASKISSTSAELTPKDVKVMLDLYFGK